LEARRAGLREHATEVRDNSFHIGQDRDRGRALRAKRHLGAAPQSTAHEQQSSRLTDFQPLTLSKVIVLAAQVRLLNDFETKLAR